MGIILLFRGCEEMVIFILKQAYNLYTLPDKLFFFIFARKAAKNPRHAGQGDGFAREKGAGTARGEAGRFAGAGACLRDGAGPLSCPMGPGTLRVVRLPAGRGGACPDGGRRGLFGALACLPGAGLAQDTCPSRLPVRGCARESAFPDGAAGGLLPRPSARQRGRAGLCSPGRYFRAAVEPRTISSGWRMTPVSTRSPAMRDSSRRAAARPSSSWGWETVVKPILKFSASRELS